MRNKNQGVLLAQLSKFFVILLFFSSSFLFSRCKNLSLSELKASYKEAHKISNEVLSFFESATSSSLLPFFHPRLKIKKEKLQAFYQIEKSRLGSFLKPSLFRVWKISSQEEKAEKIYCEKDGVSLLSHYGYPHQLAFWINLLGDKEQGVLFFSLVPKEGTYLIGSFQVVKWSHGKKGYEAWVKEALQEKSKELAYLKLDVARKLSLGSPFFEIDATKEIEALQEKLFTQKEFSHLYKNKLKSFKIESVNSIFNTKGIGLKFSYLPLEEKKEMVDMKEDCLKMKDSLGPVSRELSGIRCDLAFKDDISSQKHSYFLAF